MQLMVLFQVVVKSIMQNNKRGGFGLLFLLPYPSFIATIILSIFNTQNLTRGGLML